VSGATFVPDANARRGVINGIQVPLHPQIGPYLDLFPLPNSTRTFSGGIGEYLFSRSQPTDEHYVQGRIDHHYSNRDAIFTRYTFDDGKVNRIPINKTPIAYTGESSRNQYSTTEWRHTFSPTFLNQLRFGVNRSTSLADNVRTIDIPPSMSWIPGEKFGYFTISGVVTENGGDSFQPEHHQPARRYRDVSDPGEFPGRYTQHGGIRFAGQAGSGSRVPAVAICDVCPR